MKIAKCSEYAYSLSGACRNEVVSSGQVWSSKETKAAHGEEGTQAKAERKPVRGDDRVSAVRTSNDSKAKRTPTTPT